MVCGGLGDTLMNCGVVKITYQYGTIVYWEMSANRADGSVLMALCACNLSHMGLEFYLVLKPH